MRSTTIKFDEIPQWTYQGNTPSTHTFFAAITLASLEGELIRLSAQDQRALLGFSVFGKQTIRVLPDSTIRVSRKVSYGGDVEVCTVDLDQLMRAVAGQKVISPGCFGKKYFQL